MRERSIIRGCRTVAEDLHFALCLFDLTIHSEDGGPARLYVCSVLPVLMV